MRGGVRNLRGWQTWKKKRATNDITSLTSSSQRHDVLPRRLSVATIIKYDIDEIISTERRGPKKSPARSSEAAGLAPVTDEFDTSGISFNVGDTLAPKCDKLKPITPYFVYFLFRRASAMQNAIVIQQLRLSVRLSHADIVLKRPNRSSSGQQCTVAYEVSIFIRFKDREVVTEVTKAKIWGSNR